MEGTNPWAWIWVVVLVAVIGWLLFRVYPKAREKHEDALYRARIQVPMDFRPDMDPYWRALNYEQPGSPARMAQLEEMLRQPPQPMGPSAPTGLPAPTPPVPFGGRVGPAYLSGAMRQESEEALELIREHFPREKWDEVVKGLPNADWDVLSRMAADLLGTIRWYRKVVSKHMPDHGLAAMFALDTINLMSSCIDHYRRLAPPGPAKDQALAILGFYLRSILTGPDYNEWAAQAYLMVALSFLAKAHKERGEPV
jgi:hypothetical protein